MSEEARPLASPRAVRDLLERHGLAADKGFGQNFLVDAAVLSHIVAAADPQPDDVAFEVGPGLGVLTRELAARVRRVVAVELDRRFAPVLADTLADRANVDLHFVDALAFDMRQLPDGTLMAANLPYNVATPLLVRALESRRFRRIVALVQREVAERLVAAPGSGAYGALSVTVRHWAAAEIVRHVKPTAFLPPPKVTSSVVRLHPRADAVPAADLLDFVHTCFRHRRKTLRKNLDLAGVPRADAETALAAAGLDRQVRAEQLGIEDFRTLFRALQRGDGEGGD